MNKIGPIRFSTVTPNSMVLYTSETGFDGVVYGYSNRPIFGGEGRVCTVLNFAARHGYD
jgi:hypothetical protein